MPTGIFLSRDVKFRIFSLFNIHHKSADNVFQEQFDSDTTKISRKTLGRLKSFLRRASHEEIIDYITSGDSRKLRGSRPLLLSVRDDILLAALIEKNNGLSDRDLGVKLRDCLNPNLPPFSASTILRSRKRSRITVKRYTRIHFLADPVKQLFHYRALAKYHPDDFISTDQTYHGKGKWKQLYGKAKKNQRARKREWIVGGVRFCIYAGYTTKGFIFWRIVKVPIDHQMMETMMLEELPRLVTPSSVSIFDNASINCTPSTLDVMTQVFHIVNDG
jgi:hypothetical protein